MRFNLPIPLMVAEAREHPRFMRKRIPTPVNLIIEIGIFVLVFLVSGYLLEGIMGAVFMMPVLFTSDAFITASTQNGGRPPDMETITAVLNQLRSTPQIAIAMLFATVGGIAGSVIYCRCIEGRKLRTMGFRRGHIIREYLVGLLIGAVMFSVTVAIAVVTGSLTYGGLAGASILILLLFFFGFLVQGMSEEVLCRGYFLVSLARRQHMAVAVIVSSCFFGALHLMNDNIGVLPMVNLILFGCFEGVYLLKRGNIWGAAAIHSSWNFTQGNVFGISVSGMSLQPSVFIFEPTVDGTLISGGAFGIEGGLAASIVLAAALIIGLLMKCADPAPRVLVGSDGRSQVVVLSGAQQLPMQPVSQEYWQPPMTQPAQPTTQVAQPVTPAAAGEEFPVQDGHWPPPPPPPPGT